MSSNNAIIPRPYKRICALPRDNNGNIVAIPYTVTQYCNCILKVECLVQYYFS